MPRSARFALWTFVALALAPSCATTSTPATAISTPTPTTISTPTPTPQEVERSQSDPPPGPGDGPPERAPLVPDRGSSPPGPRIRHVLADQLGFDLWAAPRRLADGRMSLELNISFESLARDREQIIDLGPEPHMSVWMFIEAEDGSGRGSAGACSYSSNLHGMRRDPLQVGSPRTEQLLWDESIGPGERAELDIRLCGVTLPDGQRLFGSVAAVKLALGGQGELAHFALDAVAPPKPR